MDIRKLVLLLCATLTALALITPVGRIARRTELSYNEGWNIAAAMRLSRGAAGNPQLPVTTALSPIAHTCCQVQLYPAAWGWTTVNYPVASFAFLAALHTLTGDFLFTARIVSLLALLACAALLALIARALGANRRATLLTGLLCLATFSVCAVDYTGVDDPQLLGDALFLLALFVYVRHRRHGRQQPAYTTVAATAVLFVLAGSVKQSPIDFPIAVLLDLLLICRKKAAAFALTGIAVAIAAGALNRHIGGPWFVPQLLLGRLYSVAKARDVAISVLGPMLLPLVLALWTAWALRHDPRRRIAALLLLVSLAIGTYFGGGSGVAGNALFTSLFAIVLLLGLLPSWQQHPGFSLASARTVSFRPERSRVEKPASLSTTQTTQVPVSRLLVQPFLPLLPFAWLLIPALVQGIANPVANLREARVSEQRFTTASNLLQQHPGPALCESILLCLQSGKPYIFDPFNSTRLLLQGKLSQPALLADIAAHRYSAIQLHAPATASDDLFRERFPRPVLDAIAIAYTPVLQTPDAVIYLPRP